MKKKDNRKFIGFTPLAILYIIIVLLISVGYSLYSTSFAIDGSGFVRPINDIRITNIELDYYTNGGYLNDDLEYSVNNFYLSGTVPSALYSYGNIIINVTITNLSSTKVYITGLTANSFSNEFMNYELRNLVLNESYIMPASDYTFQMVISYNKDLLSHIIGLLGDIGEYLNQNNLTNIVADFTVNWAPVANHNLTINTNQQDSLIVIEQNGEVIGTATGHFSQPVEENVTITWTVSKTGYVPQSGTVYMDSDKSINVNLSLANHYNLTINPTPPDATVIIQEGETVLANGSGSQTVNVYDQHTISYIVKKVGYNTKYGTTSTNGQNTTVSVVLETATPFEGTFTNTAIHTVEVVSEEIYKDGYYLVEMWGGKGGRGNLNLTTGLGGDAGYVYGIVHLNYEDNVYITLGGNGESTSSDLLQNDVSLLGGANGGGASTGGGASGGGYSLFGINMSSITLENVNNNKILMIAGGGGGGGTRTVTAIAGSGGAGGIINSSATTSYTNGTIYNGGNGTTTINCSSFPATGGTNVGGTNSGVASAYGSLFTGGTAILLGGGGGAGFYGGAGGGSQKASIINLYAGSGGGGGSSYVNSSVTAVSSAYSSQLINTNPSSTGGALKITYLGTTLN